MDRIPELLVEVQICMGSSCFSRGNNRILGVIQDYIREQGLQKRVTVKGTLCNGVCKQGPNLTINGRPYPQVTPESVRELLRALLAGSPP